MAKVEELVIPLQKKLSSLTDKMQKVRSEIKEYDKNLFLSNGGCTKCDGRGWIVIWDTLDCMNGSYADYSKCTNTNCTPITRKTSGMLPRRNKYDRNQYKCLCKRTLSRHAEQGRPIPRNNTTSCQN